MEKTAFQMGVEDALEDHMEKEAIALTGEGHELAAGRAKAQRDMHAGNRKAEGKYQKAAPGRSALLRGVREPLERMSERHQDYKAKKHEDKRNPMNPFGGMLTKSRSEKK